MNDPGSSVHREVPKPDEALPPPYPMRKRHLWRTVLGAAGLTVTVGGVAFILLASSMTRTRGATCSARLKWEERRRQVDQAVQDATDAQPEASRPVGNAPAASDSSSGP